MATRGKQKSRVAQERRKVYFQRVVGATTRTPRTLKAPVAPLETRLARAAMGLLQATQDTMTVADIRDHLNQGNWTGLMEFLNLENRMWVLAQGAGLPADQRSLIDVIREVFQYGAEQELKSLDKIPVAKAGIGSAMSFDLLNDQAVNWIRNYSFNLIRGISQESRLAVQEILMRGFQEGNTVDDMAREIRAVIGLSRPLAQAVVNFRSMLQSGDPSRMSESLTRELRDGRFDGSVLRAIREETTLPREKINTLVDRYATRALNYRAYSISRSETIRASNAGQSETWDQAVQQGYLAPDQLRIWIASDDACERCLKVEEDNADGVPLNEPFNTDDGPLDYPGLHTNCRCAVGLLVE